MAKKRYKKGEFGTPHLIIIAIALIIAVLVVGQNSTTGADIYGYDVARADGDYAESITIGPSQGIDRYSSDDFGAVYREGVKRIS